MSNYPSVSIVIPSYNQGIYIERTLLSILKQDYPGEVQVIVSDGGSTDETVEILKKYPQITWWSERDKGFVDAVMKGFAVAKGDTLAIQSSDDFYLKDALKNTIIELVKNPNLSIVSGFDVFLQPDLKSYSLSPVSEYKITPRALLKRCIPQHCAFFRRRVLEKIGGLRYEVDTCADIDFWYRSLHFFEGQFIPLHTAVYQHHSNQRTKVLKNWTSSLIYMIESCEKNPIYGNHFKLTAQEKLDQYTLWEIIQSIKDSDILSSQDFNLLQKRIEEILESDQYSEPTKQEIRGFAINNHLLKSPPRPSISSRFNSAIKDGRLITRILNKVRNFSNIQSNTYIDIEWWK